MARYAPGWQPTAVGRDYSRLTAVALAPTPPEPLTRAQVKEHLRLSESDTLFDATVDTLIATARQYLEDTLTDRAFIQQKWDWVFQTFPEAGAPLALPKPPIISATVAYYDTDDTEQTFTDFSLVNYHYTAGKRDELWLDPDEQEWPSVYDRHDAVKVTFTAGYADVNDIPQHALHAMRLLIGHWFAHPEDSSDMNMGATRHAVDALTASMRVR